MIGPLITRGLLMVFGYAYPAYECFKTVEKNKPDIVQLHFWCQYWILVAVLTVCERIGDTLISWVPMYSEAKLAFVLYLWCPKTKGTTYVYDCFFKPIVLEHEEEIDRNLMELRIRAEDLAVSCWQRSASYIQTRILDFLQYFASHSTPSRPKQQQQGARDRQNGKQAETQKQIDQPPSPEPTSSPSQDQEGMEEEGVPSHPPKEDPPAAVVNAQKATIKQALAKTAKTSSSNEVEVMQIDSMPHPDDETAELPSSETKIEEAGRVTRARSRKTSTAPNR